MVAALFVTNAALDRARRQKKGASTLSFLQVVAATPGIRPTEIAAAQNVHPSQVTRQVRELEPAFPQLDHLLAVRIEHVVAKDGVEIGDQVLEVAGPEQFVRLVVDLENADLRCALPDP